MPFNDPEENQDETAAPVVELEPDYPAGGPRIATNMSAGILPVGSPTKILLPGARTALWPTQGQESLSQPAPGIGHRIVAMGQEQASPLGGAFSSGKVEMRPPQQAATNSPGLFGKPREQRLGIGHRILGIPGQPKSVLDLKPLGVPRPEPLVYPNSAGAGFNGLPQSQGIFSSFVPVGATPREKQTTRDQPAQSQSGHVSEGLGKAAGASLGAMKGADALATAARQYSASNNRHTPVVDASNLVRARSRIHEAKPAPEVKPNLAIRPNKYDRDQFKKTLQTVMKGMDEPRAPKAARHLTEDDKERTAHEAYGETATGSVEEYEAIISVMLNRVRSGDRQYVDRGQAFTVANVIAAHTRKGTHQFQAIDNTPYANFSQAKDQGSQNARTAAENVAAHGPANSATHFIVLPPPKPTKRGQPPIPVGPSKEQRAALGHVKPAGQVGNVFLYENVPPARTSPRVGSHRHHRGVPQRHQK